MLKEKILNNEKLTADEVHQIVYGDLEDDDKVFIYDIEEYEDTRWYRIMGVILKIDNRFFSIFYYKGLTEYQENEYEDQVAQEVEPVEVIRIEWVPKEKQ